MSPAPTHMKIASEAWKTIEDLLGDLPFKVSVGVVKVLQETGGVVPLDPEPTPVTPEVVQD